MKTISFISSLFFEKKCYGCQKSWHFFCPSCNEKLEIYKPYCYVCKSPSQDFFVHQSCKKYFPLDQVIVLTHYRQNEIKRFLRHGKYYGKYRIYDEIIRNNKDFFRKYVTENNALLLPVPMHFLRRWKRWYNQTEKIAHALSSVLDIPVYNKILYKKKYTKNQSHLSRSNRQINLSDSFWLRDSQLSKDITIYLVDDVVSTGSTLSEIAKALRKKWFEDIRAIVLASD